MRRKVYFYQYRFDRIFIFSRKRWGVQPVAYDWDDVTAEVYRIYAPGHGGLIENVMLSVRNPETDEVIDRVFFTHTLHEGEAYWAIPGSSCSKALKPCPSSCTHPATGTMTMA
ncbi:hypothetical protein PPUJ20005_32480 [Pseudomonas putida]|nr:hypothetical protein PPUJ20005_32480 [Pseudomonas putida]